MRSKSPFIPWEIKGLIKEKLGLTYKHNKEHFGLVDFATGSQIIFDVGAHRGGFMTSTLLAYPRVNVLCFEPNVEVFPTLEKVCNEMGRCWGRPRAQAFHMGLGATETEQDFIISNYEKGSSFLPHNEAVKKAWETLDLTQKKSVKTKISTVDAIVERESIASIKLLKIDVEGFELEVLKGSLKTLPVIEYVLIECQFTVINQGAADWQAVVAFMHEHNFSPVFMADICMSAQGRVIIADILFQNNQKHPS